MGQGGPQREGLNQLQEHPKYCHPSDCWFNSFNNDIMLLHLKYPLEISNGVEIIPLPTTGPRTGSSCILSSWDAFKPPREPNPLTCAKFKILPDEECKKPERVTETMFCAADEDYDQEHSCWDIDLMFLTSL
ncbi:PREDICTED: prostatic glandular kallikrein-6-like [Elephantulus edwardii]|uniref:prostatic glandular kallikrein-6-like n=1 Tax=Elephantulus edwardii TaxID=28737 RepID=UPI0003F0ED22|nr:PREDICTED: prostatic glandular kallikrein-6-like [Elephantulus edwardii]